jgi:hypothetical protein
MLSIIICSRDAVALQRVSANVAATIGVVYELIGIDNSAGEYGICAAYNLGASQAQYGLLCFMHEDIRFHTQGWGQEVVRLLADPTIGVLGVAGSTYQPNAPAGWTAAGTERIAMNVLHSDAAGGTKLDYKNPAQTQLVQVATLDGLWLCVSKHVWEEFRFDEQNFPGFHFYDIDFCTRVFTKYKNFVTFGILIEHFSRGSFDKRWLDCAVHYYKVRSQYLPFGINKIPSEEEKKLSLAAFQLAANQCIFGNMGDEQTSFLLKSALAKDLFNRDSWWLVKSYIKKLKT